MHLPLAQMAGRLAPQTDRELLGRFARDRDGAAFAALVHRHGPTVYGVCRRVLGNPADAEDAFQAVFLVLVNRADALSHRPTLGGWLHEVAVRVALKARTGLARLRKHERRAALARGELTTDPPPADPPAWLDRELAVLPDRLREPVVRCLVQGRPRAEVAAELGIPEGTLASRLDAARKRLAVRLARHRLTPAVGGLLVPVPATLTAATVARAADGAGAFVHQLASEVTKAMIPNTKLVTLAAAAALAAVGGVLAAVAGGPSADPPATVPTVRRAEPRQAPKGSPEPAWMAAFRMTYELKDGEVVKRVAPPYIPERVEFYLHRIFQGKKVDPAREDLNRAHTTEVSLFFTYFLEQDGNKLKERHILSSAGLQDHPDKRRGGNLLTAEQAVSSVIGIEQPEYVIDPKAKEDPLLATTRSTGTS